MRYIFAQTFFKSLIQIAIFIHLGFYAAYLQEWLSVFPRDQILVMRTEDYSANTTLLTRTVFDFLDLSSYIHMYIMSICSSLSALHVPIIFNKTKTKQE